MADLVAKSPCEGLLPLQIGGIGLREVDLGHLTTVAPFAGQQEKLDQLLKAAHGVGYPAPNRSQTVAESRILWFGRDMALLAGPQPDPSLSQAAALTDQSDAWASVVLEGAGADEVLARLVPVDLRPAHFQPGHTCRTTLGHMHASVTRISDTALQVLVFRSMVVTMADELRHAMEAVAARGLRNN